MSVKPHIKLIHEGQYVAEVEIELMESETGWSPTMSLADASRLDEVRELLRRGDVQGASRFGKVYKLLPLGA